jgi:hypothetical protein
VLTRIALGYQRGVDRITEFAGTISWFLVLPLVFIGFANVVLRYIGAAREAAHDQRPHRDAAEHDSRPPVASSLPVSTGDPQRRLRLERH